MPHCAAFGCNFQSKGNKGSDVSLHCFPTDKKRRKEWEDACGRAQLPKDPRLCSRHFSPDAFEAFSRPQLLKELTGAAGYKWRLKPNALPTIFPHKEHKRPLGVSEMRQRQETPDVSLICFCQSSYKAGPPGTFPLLWAEEIESTLDSSVAAPSWPAGGSATWTAPRRRVPTVLHYNTTMWCCIYEVI